MTGGWAIHAVVLYALVATCMILLVGVFAGVKAEVHRQAARWTGREKELEKVIAELRSELADTRSDLDRVERHSGMLVPPQAPRSGMNLSARSQALRMHRSGEEPEAIAVALGLPRQEVELLIRVHRLVLEHVG